MLDTQGNVIGIVVQKVVGVAVEGVSFAIPIESALASIGSDVFHWSEE